MFQRNIYPIESKSYWLLEFQLAVVCTDKLYIGPFGRAFSVCDHEGLREWCFGLEKGGFRKSGRPHTPSSIQNKQ
jgi:hypothetical protein